MKSNLSATGVLLSVLLTVKTFKDARVFWSRYSFTNSLYGSPGYFVQQSKVSGSKKINITKRRSMQGNQDVKQRTKNAVVVMQSEYRNVSNLLGAFPLFQRKMHIEDNLKTAEE